MIRSSPTGDRRTRKRSKFRRSGPGVPVYTYRHYDPLTGRWPSRDPIEERGGLNFYAFVVNDGVNRLDLFGLQSAESILKCRTCEGTASFTVDCRWTGSMNGHRTVGATLAVLIPYKLDAREFPDHARVWWDNICKDNEKLTDKKLIANPSGANNLDIMGANSARTSLQSRYFSTALALAANPLTVIQAEQHARALGAAALPLTKADFCCCKKL